MKVIYAEDGQDPESSDDETSEDDLPLASIAGAADQDSESPDIDVFEGLHLYRGPSDEVHHELKATFKACIDKLRKLRNFYRHWIKFSSSRI